jgi:uncharacterized protein YndB with AHSA1/START domain
LGETVVKDPDFVYITFIGATPEKVWEGLTSNDFIAKYWSGHQTKTDWKPGSPVTMYRDNGKVDWDGKILESDPPRKLSYTFRIHGYQEESSRVVIELEPKGSNVKLTLSHYDIEAKCRKGIAEGWSGIISDFKTLLETGKSLNMPACSAKE